MDIEKNMNKKKIKHFSCKNCKRFGKIVWRNGYICAGLIKKLRLKNDFYRLCISKYGLKFDFMAEELISLANLTTYLLLIKKLKGYKKIKCLKKK